MLRYILTWVICITTWQLFAQKYPLGLNPPDMEWYQIDTEKVRVIYPLQAQDQAQRVVNLIHYLYDSSLYTLGPKKAKVDIILQNQTTISNGFVTTGPFRSEFYTTSPQYNFSGTTDWIDLLAIHEYRHVEQFVNAKQGITRLGSYAFGQYGWFFFAGMALPRWFFEGDAVYYETALTNAGRGRMPAFENEYKAIWLSGRKFGYEKAAATSLKEFVPNHYTLGYLINASIRNRYGHDTWEKVMHDAVRYRGVIFPFNHAIKRHTGTSMPKYYKQMTQELSNNWHATGDTENEEIARIINQPKKTFTNYKTPIFIREDALIVEKSAFNEISTYYLLETTGKETKMLKPGIFLDDNATLSYAKEKFVWSELAFDKRWGNRDYSVIMSYDTQTGIKKRITEKSRYFSPSLSVNASWIAAIWINDAGTSVLEIIQYETGEIAQSLNLSDYQHASFPVWIDTNHILLVVKKNHQNGFIKVNIQNGQKTELSPFWDEVIGYPVMQDNMIFFTGNFQNQENIYAYDVIKHEIFQVTFEPFGARQATISPLGSQIAYSAYTHMGYDLKVMPIDPSKWKKIQSSEAEYLLSNTLVNSPILAQIPAHTYKEERYPYHKDLINFHSWSPWILPPNGGIQVFSNNLMSSFNMTGSASYNINERRSSVNLSAEYGAQFISFNARMIQANRMRYIPAYYEEVVDGQNRPYVNIFNNQWRENGLSVGWMLPLNLTKGNFFSNFSLYQQLQSLQVDYADDRLGTDERFGTHEWGIDFYAVQRTARQHIYPRIGLTFNLAHKTTFATTANESRYFMANGRLFMPGFFKTHHFFIGQWYQTEPFAASYKFMDNFFYARGYFGSTHDRISKTDFNYALPLFYPDLALGPVMFIKRVKANFFFDSSQILRNGITTRELVSLTSRNFSGNLSEERYSLRSMGVELTFDMRLFRLLETNSGVRFSYLLDAQPGQSNRYNINIILLSVGL